VDKETLTSDICYIALTTKTGETFVGKMSRRQPDLVNGSESLATARISGMLRLDNGNLLG
jgi:hypothetical protein